MNKLFLKISACFFALCFFALSVFSSSNLSVEVFPVPAFAGENCQIVFSSPDAVPKVIEFPELDGIKWHPNSLSTQQSTQIINGKVSNSFISRYTFTVQNAGSYKIPPIKVQLGKVKTVSNPVEINVLKRKYNVQAQGSAPGRVSSRFLVWCISARSILP